MIAILATIATATILVLNPAELLKNARDSNRLSDLASLNTALTLFQTDQYNLSLGTASTTYVSVPDSSPVCANLGLPTLPTLPSGWAYACSSSTNFQKVDGTGWIPVNFSLISSGSPLSKLPIDPINTTTTGQYYTYTPGGSWELTSTMEASKNKMGGSNDKTSTDMGSYPDLYELGSNLSLLPVDRDSSLVGYWKFDEGSGTTAYDASGKGNNGSFSGSLTWRSGSECVRGNCIETTGSGQINIPYNSSLNLTNNVTYINWVKIKTAIPASQWPYSLGNANSHIYYGWRANSNGTLWIFEYGSTNPTCDGVSYTNLGGIDLGTSTWHQLAATYDGATIKNYLDGVLVYTRSFSLGFCSNTSMASYVLAQGPGTGVFVVDKGRIYSRALSAAEIQAIYRAGQ